MVTGPNDACLQSNIEISFSFRWAIFQMGSKNAVRKFSIENVYIKILLKENAFDICINWNS